MSAVQHGPGCVDSQYQEPGISKEKRLCKLIQNCFLHLKKNENGSNVKCCYYNDQCTHAEIVIVYSLFLKFTLEKKKMKTVS